jgi:ABC-2 type transport system ATP-binding protein
MTAIRTGDLRKVYGDVTALDGLSLTVESGELYGLLGPNGAGKTTTMELLTGQTVPDDGEATVLGVDPAAEPVGVRELVGILPEKESPPSFFTPREYLQFVGAVRDIDDDTVDERTADWADRLGFAEKLDTLATDLSRGQQQKTMIAGAFLHEPDLVFIDEPLANLDPIVQERVKRFLVDYHEAGNTVVISTHNVEVAAALCSRVGIVSAGELVAEVVPDELGPDETLLDAFMRHVEPDGRADDTAAAAVGGPEADG